MTKEDVCVVMDFVWSVSDVEVEVSEFSNPSVAHCIQLGCAHDVQYVSGLLSV
jgi:hypothetical protein